MADRNTELRYIGAIDAVEVPVPENDRAFDEPRHLYVIRGHKISVSAAHAKGLVASGDFEPVKADRKGGAA